MNSSLQLKVVTFLCATMLTNGIKLSLDPYTKTTNGRKPCGIVRCTVSEPGVARVSRMEVHRQLVTEGVLDRTTEVSVTKGYPTVNEMSDGKKRYGKLSGKSAYVSIILVDPEDCLTCAFSCDATFEDKAGKEWVSSSSLARSGTIAAPGGTHSQSVAVLNLVDRSLQRYQERLDDQLCSVKETLAMLQASVRTIDNDKSTTCEKGTGPVLRNYYVVESADNTPLYLCDGQTDGGGWIVIQRRVNGDVDFYKGWEDYKNGFGSFGTSFWLGNEMIHKLTHSTPCELNITVHFKGKIAYAYYDMFSLGHESTKYQLTLGAYSGSAGDSLAYNNGMKFTTFDSDNDGFGFNCADIRHGAWWYRDVCGEVGLNGKYGAAWGDSVGLSWSTFTQSNQLEYTEMKIRRK